MNIETETQTPKRNNWLIFGAGGFTVVALCACMAFAGFAIGRATTSADAELPTPETIVQEVTVVVTELVPIETVLEATLTLPNTATPSATDAPPPATPAPLPTATPNIAATDIDPDAIDFSTFVEAWNLLEEQYDGNVPDEDALLRAAIQGSLELLNDDYTRYFPPRIAARMRDDLNGSVSGIGAIVRENDAGAFEIVRPIPDQPAELAGILPGDIITGVDGRSVEGVSFDEVILQVRGPEGTAVTLTIYRPSSDEQLEITVVRATFTSPIITSRMVGDDENPIGYVHLSTFNAQATTELSTAVSDLLAQNPVGLIFDLRDNGGGFLNQSVSVADLFLPESIVLLERNNRGLDRTFRADDGDMAETIPLVVLVNAGSASASEIVAGAIQDNGRGILIGETTFGKGSVQQINILEDGAELRITIARWYTPNNNTIDKEGITPNIEVLFPLDYEGEEDLQLQAAIDFLTNP